MENDGHRWFAYGDRWRGRVCMHRHQEGKTAGVGVGGSSLDHFTFFHEVGSKVIN